MNDQPKPTTGEWTVRQFAAQNSWDIYYGETRIIGDLLKDECEQIADAHNAALAAEKRKVEELHKVLGKKRMEIKQLKGEIT